MIVLIALVASVGAVALAGASDTADWRESIAIVRSTDADARSLARTSGPVTLTLNAEHNTLRLRAGDELVLARRVPVTIHLVDPSSQTPMDELRYDPAGRSRDAVFVLSAGDRRETLRIAGLTGWASR